MRRLSSVRAQLLLLFSFFFMLTGTLGLFSILQLSSFNRSSEDIAEVWLPTTRALGDLNNYTSDFHAAENSIFNSELSKGASEELEFEALDRSIAQAQRDFESIPHSAEQQALYTEFRQHWGEYRSIVNRTVAVIRAGNDAQAALIHRDTSRPAYAAADEVLTRLTNLAASEGKSASRELGVTYRRAFWLIGLAILLAALLVSIAFLYITRAISGPLLRLAGSLRLLAENHTEINIPATNRRDEIGEMTRAAVIFRDNALELVRSRSELARQAALLKDQLKQEQELASRQRNFLSMASHEFRTPLTIIDGHARRMTKTVMSQEELRERAEKIRAAALRLTQLTENLLQASRLADSAPTTSIVEFDLAKLLREVSQLHRDIAPHATIIETCPERIPFIGDRQLLFQAFSNLLSNAVKYTISDQPIHIDAVATDQHITIQVIDKGIGIPASDFVHLFERYYRGSNVSGIVGTGVGLYIVRMVVELHGGTVAVNSEEGRGSRFIVRLPMNVPIAVSPLARDETTQYS